MSKRFFVIIGAAVVIFGLIGVALLLQRSFSGQSAHLQITPLLSTEQIAEYNKLRGYTNEVEQLSPGSHPHQGH